MNGRIRKGLTPLSLLLVFTGLAAFATAEDAPAQRLKSFGSVRSCRGVSASAEWLSQARVGGFSLNLRLTTQTGTELAFMERLTASKGEEGMALELLASRWPDGLTLQVDQRALDTLARLGVTRLVLADSSLHVRERYDVQELSAIRELLELGEKEQLCVAGENAPLTVLSEDGVRRQVTR